MILFDTRKQVLDFSDEIALFSVLLKSTLNWLPLVVVMAVALLVIFFSFDGVRERGDCDDMDEADDE